MNHISARWELSDGNQKTTTTSAASPPDAQEEPKFLQSNSHISYLTITKNIMDHRIFAKRCITSLPSQQHTQPTICFIDTHHLPQNCERQVQSLRDLPSLLNTRKCQRSPSHSRFHRSVLYSAFPPRTPRTSIALKPPIYAPHKNATKPRNSSQ
jgi:hypothetical protein